MRETLPTVMPFQYACKDDIDEALSQNGFREVTTKEAEQFCRALFLSALGVIIDLVSSSRNVRSESGPDGPAALTGSRQAPLDGDVFRLCDVDVAKKGE